MKREEAGPEATRAKSPDTSKPETYQDRFNAALEAWRKEGCSCSKQNDVRCGARPHRVRMLPKDADGNLTMSVDCVDGHEGVWQFKVPAEEMARDAAAQAEAMRRAEADAGSAPRDPMKASLKITMDLKTQAISIDQWVPTPGVGIQLAGILMSHFFAQIQQAGPAPGAGGLVLPGEKKLLDRNGKPIIN